LLSFPRKRESSLDKAFWTPAFAGVTTWGTFYESVNIEPSEHILLAGFSKTLRYKAPEIPRNEPRRLLRDAVTRDEGNAVDGRFSATC